MRLCEHQINVGQLVVPHLFFDISSIYLSEQSQAALVFFCAVLQHSIALLALIFASLDLL